MRGRTMGPCNAPSSSMHMMVQQCSDVGYERQKRIKAAVNAGIGAGERRGAAKPTTSSQSESRSNNNHHK